MTTTMSTTREGVEAETRPFDAAEALLTKWQDAGMLSDDEEKEGANSHSQSETDDDEEDNEDHSAEEGDEDQEDQDDDSESDDSDNDGEEGEDEDDGEQPEYLDNLDTKVKIKIDGEERTVSVKDLTRLFGQEASLTRKSQEVADLRKKAEDEGARFTVASEALLKRALEKYAPYSKIDWVVAQSKLEPDELVALRNEARVAAEDVMFLQNQVTGLFEQAQQDRQGQLMEAARECMDVLSNPETGIKGWNNQLYDDIRAYAVKQGMDQNAVDMMVDPVAFKLLDKARRFDQAQATAQTKTRKKAKAPKKVLKSKTKSGQSLGKNHGRDEALQRLRASGDPQDAARALMAGWAEGDED